MIPGDDGLGNLDTSIYIDHWEEGKHDARLLEVRRGLVIRHSAVVLSELRRGARTLRARRMVEALRALAPVIREPTSEDWWIAEAPSSPREGRSLDDGMFDTIEEG